MGSGGRIQAWLFWNHLGVQGREEPGVYNNIAMICLVACLWYPHICASLLGWDTDRNPPRRGMSYLVPFLEATATITSSLCQWLAAPLNLSLGSHKPCPNLTGGGALVLYGLGNRPGLECALPPPRTGLLSGQHLGWVRLDSPTPVRSLDGPCPGMTSSSGLGLGEHLPHQPWAPPQRLGHCQQA